LGINIVLYQGVAAIVVTLPSELKTCVDLVVALNSILVNQQFIDELIPSSYSYVSLNQNSANIKWSSSTGFNKDL
jgi:hypothetical protein